MTKNFRRKYAFFLSVVFLITAPILILYALGFRLGNIMTPETPSVEMTGGLSIKTLSDYTLLFNDETLSKSPILKTGIRPGTYPLEISKDGFQTWKKNLSIEPSLVTAVDSVILFENTPALTPTDTNTPVKEVIASPSNGNFIYVSHKSDKSGLWLYDTNNQTQTKLVDSKSILGTDSLLYEDINWSEEGESLTFRVNINNQNFYYLLSDIYSQNPQLTNITNRFNYDINQTSIKKIHISGNTITSLQGGHVFQFSLLDKKITPPIASNVQKITIKKDKIVYFDNVDKNIKSLDLNNLDAPSNVLTSKLTFEPKALDITLNNAIFITDIDNNFYSLTLGNPTLQSPVIIPTIKGSVMGYSKDQKKMIISDGKTIYLLFLADFEGAIDRQQGDIVNLYQSTNTISNIRFFGANEQYALFLENNTLKAVEFDNRDYPQTFTLSEDTTTYIEKSSNTDSVFYILSNKTEQISKFSVSTGKNLFNQ
jgi:hypothetical protein